MTNQTPNFYALLIGIDFYFPHRLAEGNYYKNLRGCVQDINHVETYLKDTFNLTSDQIIKLTASATENPNQPKEPPEILNLLKKKYVLCLKVCSSLGQTFNYWVDWHLLKLAQPARLDLLQKRYIAILYEL